MTDYCEVAVTGKYGGLEPPDFEVTLLEPRPFRPFKSSEEYLYAMKEDLAEWLNGLYEGLNLDADNFLEQMETGVILCQHANNVVRKAREYYRSGNASLHPDAVRIPERDVVYRYDVLPETFHARDNVSNFISWCRSLCIKECLLFETDDLVLRKNERSFILCLLEVARRGVQFGMPAPLLVQLEQEIDAEIAKDDDGYETQVVTNNLRSLHQRVVELLSRCTCPSQFPMIRVADGKYRIGDTKVLIFVRILRTHVMVRVGGGWDTLAHYLDKHDPCRCRSGHRLATSAKLSMMSGKSAIPSMHVTYNRPPQAPFSTPSSPQTQRRSLSYLSPTTGRRSFHHSISPPTTGRPLPPCSDDSSTSSLQENGERKSGRNRDTSSDDECSEEDPPTSSRRESVTAPSSWKYSSRKEQPVTVAFSTGYQRRDTKLPSLTFRSEGKQPPKVGKVSPRPHFQQPYSEDRSQSSEDLCPGPAHGTYHSRGPSPVNPKGFRRNDPKRHSSPRMSQVGRLQNTPKTQIIPPTPRNGQPLQQRHPPNTPKRRMFYSPERPRHAITRKNSAPEELVFEKLLQHSDLCADRDFVLKIEQLIAEFQSKTKMADDREFHSLPANQKQPRKHLVKNGLSKIPLPMWHSK